MPARIQGNVLSILLARASSSAPAEYGFWKIWRSSDELTCVVDVSEGLGLAEAALCSSDGLSSGDEKDSR